MEDSVLDTIKAMLGVSEDAFDTELIIHINSVLSTLHQLGATPDEGIKIDDATLCWSDWLLKPEQLNMVKTYVYLKVRLIFDPPGTSFGINSLEKLAGEFEWRITVNEFVFNPDWNVIPEPVVEDEEL